MQLAAWYTVMQVCYAGVSESVSEGVRMMAFILLTTFPSVFSFNER